MFIQIGDHGFNTNHITRCRRFVDDGEMSIEVHTSDGGYSLLKNDDALDFANWWDTNCSVQYSPTWYSEPRDPMQPDYEKLAAEEHNTFGAEGRDSSGYGQV